MSISSENTFSSIPPGDAGGDGTGIGPSERNIHHTLDATQDLGMDSTGDTPINNILSDISDNTEVVYPPGTYKINPGDSGYVPGVLIDGNEIWHHGYRSQSRNEVRFQLPDGKAGVGFEVNGEAITFSNLSFDHSNHPATVFGLKVSGDGETRFENVQHVGRNLPPESLGEPFRTLANDGEQVHCWEIDIADTGECRIIDYKWADPEVEIQSSPNSLVRLYAPSSMNGEISLVNAHMAWGGEHNVYLDNCGGSIGVRGGFFHNTCNTNLHIDGDGSSVRNSTIKVDMPDSRTSKDIRGIQWKDSGNGYPIRPGGFIDNCNFIFDTDLSESESAALTTESGAGDFAVKNCRFYHNDDTTPASIINTSGTEFLNCSFTGFTTQPPVQGNGSTQAIDCCNALETSFQDCTVKGLRTNNCSTPPLQ